MTLPINACSDEELEGYATIHPEAAAALAERIAAGRHLKDLRVEEPQEELREAERIADDADDQFSSLRDEAQHAVDQLKELLGAEMPPQEKHDALLRVVTKLGSSL